MESRFAIKGQNCFTLLVLWVWAQGILAQYIRALLTRFPIIGWYSEIVLTCFFILIVLLALPCFRINKGDILLILFIIAIFMLEWFFYEDGQEYLDKYIVSFVVKILPLYFVGVSLGEAEDENKIVYEMYIVSMVTLFASIAYRFTFGTPMSDAISKYVGDMDHAYKLLPHCCLIAYFAFKKPSLLNVVCVAVGGFYLLMLGTRGVALLYLVLISLLLIMRQTSKGIVARIVVIFGSVVGFVVSPWYDAAVLWMYQKAQQFGLSVRIFDKLLTRAVSSSSGRDRIGETLFSFIKENPFFGYGLCSDRVLSGGYAHNVALELWTEFGVIFGTVIIIAVVVVLLRGYKATKEEGEKGLMLALIFSSFFKLFLSGSYLDERLLMLLLGLCVCSIRKAKRESILLTEDIPYDCFTGESR